CGADLRHSPRERRRLRPGGRGAAAPWRCPRDDPGAERQPGGAGAPTSRAMVLDTPPLEGPAAKERLIGRAVAVALSAGPQHICPSNIRGSAMPAYRSRTSTHGRNKAGARGLWRATGMKDGDFGKPIIAIVNSFTQFVPGHVHLKDLGQLVAREVEAAGGVAKEFNTIAV